MIRPTDLVAPGPTGPVATVAAGVNVSVNNGDPANPVVAVSVPEVSATNLGDKTHAINTTGKTKWKIVANTTTSLLYFALGTADVSKWRLTGAVDSTGDVTPA